MNSKLNYLLVCENAFITNGKLSVILIFNKIFTKGLPFLHPKLSVVSNVSADVGSYNESIEIVSPNGQIIAKATAVIDIKEGGGNNLIVDFIGPVFNEEGIYSISVSLDGQKLTCDTTLVIRKRELSI